MAECEMYGVFIKQIHDELEKQINNQLRSEDLTMAQVGTLVILNRTSESRMPLKETGEKASRGAVHGAGHCIASGEKGPGGVFWRSGGPPGQDGADYRQWHTLLPYGGEACEDGGGASSHRPGR